MKGKCYVFSGYKERNKVLFLFPECRLQKDRYGSYMFNLKCCKTVETTYLEKRKKTNKGRETFFEFKVLTEREQLFYWTLSTNKPSKVHLFSVQKPQIKR